MDSWKKKLSLIITLGALLILFWSSGTVKAATPYMIKINKGTNVVTVYSQNKKGNYTKPVRAFVCSVGNATPTGTFPLQYKMRWGLLMGPSYGQYCSVITGDILFHSVWYYSAEKNTQSYVEYNKLGTTASHGCVRLTTIDAKWIYDNCASGTPVKIFNGTSKHDKLGKPASISLAGSRGWDPTDPDPNNPFHKYFPKFSGIRNRKVRAFTKFNPKSGVKASGGNGENLTRKIQVSGKVNTQKAGIYKLTYQVEDKYHRPTTKTITVTVVDKTKPIIKGAKNRTVKYGEKVNFLKGVTAKMKNGTNITKSLRYKTQLNSKKPGKYNVRFIATGTNGKKSSVVVVFTVLEKPKDTKPDTSLEQPEDSKEQPDVPENPDTSSDEKTDVTAEGVKITGVTDRTLNYTKADMSEEEKIKLIQDHALENVIGTYDGELAESGDFEIKVTKKSDNQYTVRYILEDIDRNKITETAIFTLVHIEEEK